VRSPTFIGAVALGAVTLALRLVYAATVATDLDGIQDVVGAGHFDVAHGAPLAPGSWLYVAAGQALHVVTGLGLVTSLVFLAALTSAAAAALTYVAGTALGGRFVGAAAGVLVASSPLSWFVGSTVSTYGIDALLGALLIVLARRARPYRAHGLVAVVALGLAAGIRLSVIPVFALLAAIAVVASVRTVGQLLATVTLGAASVAAWFVPMITIQPGGFHAWLHAVHLQATATTDLSSVFGAPSAAVLTNLGTFAGWSLLSLGPVLVLGLLGLFVLGGARLATRHPSGNVTLRIWARASEPADDGGRPWYQGTGAIVSAALLPAVAYVTLWHFNDGGDVLSYLVPATVLFLLPVARLLHHRSWNLRRVVAVVTALLITLVVVTNIQRFVSSPGILPASVASDHPGLWLAQTRYSSPYTYTADAIRKAKITAGVIQGLRSEVNPATDVIVVAQPDDGTVVTRTVASQLTDVRVALVDPFTTMDLGGLLYRPDSTTLQVGPGGHAVVLTTKTVPALTYLRSQGLATETNTRVHAYHVWLVSPGSTLWGVTVTAVAGPRPLGRPFS
jgi:hypothetical protein